MKYLAIIPCETYVMQLRDEEQVRFVYMIQCESTGRIKIGITDDVESRVGDIQRMSPSKLNIIAVFASDGNAVEGFFHRTFRNYRIHGEWFEPDDSMIEQIENMKNIYAREKKTYKDIAPDWILDSDDQPPVTA